MTSENPTPTASEVPATMKAVIMRAPGDVVVETVETPRVVQPTDVVLKLAAACVCGSDLWPYRGHNEVDHRRMGHEYVGTIVEKGAEVATLELGDFVIGSFMLSDNTCEICQAGYQSRCVNAGEYTGSQAQYMRVELADGSLVKVPGGEPADPDRLADYLAASDVLGTGWYAAVAAQAGPGKTSPSPAWACAAWRRRPSRTTRPACASWPRWGCATRACSRRSRCISPAGGSTASPTRCSPPSTARRAEPSPHEPVRERWASSPPIGSDGPVRCRLAPNGDTARRCRWLIEVRGCIR